MRLLLVGTSLSALALAVSVPASAQDVVMRRPLPISNQSGNAGWQTSEFRPVDSSGNPVLPQDACGLYTERRDVWCDNDKGERVDEYFCSSEPKPADSRPQFHDSGCSYSWDTTAWNDPGDSCTLTETQTRSVTCRRDLDNAVVNDDKCSAAKPSSTQVLPDFSTCSYSWKTDAFEDNGPSCVLAEVQNRNVWCERDLDGAKVGDAMCDAGARSAGSQTVEDIRSCTYSWDAGSWVDPGESCTATETQTRNVECKRDLDGAVASDAQCNAATRPSASKTVEDYSSCSYSAVNPGAWTYASTCSANTTRTRELDCRRSDGTIVADSECTSRSISLTETENTSNYSSCTNSWETNAWVDPGASCTASETQTRSVWCKRDLDGAVQADSSCNAGARPAASQTVVDYSGCSYSAVNWTAWNYGSTCSANTTRSRTADCRRSDGTIVADSQCTSRGIALSETESGVSNLTSCGYAAANWSAWNYASTCSANTTRTQTAQCRRSDGTIVANSECTSRGISLTNSESGVSNLTSCSYSAVNPSAWSYASSCSSNTSRTQTYQCQRSDGTIVANSECTSRSISLTTTQNGVSNYAGCTYNGSSSQSSCSNGYQNVDYTCTRSDGVVVANSNCGLPSGTQQAACSSYSWQTGSWSGWSACAGSSQSQTRAVWCQEKTGATTSTVSDSFCGGGKPASSDTQSCTMPTVTTPVVFNYKTGIGCSGSILRSVTWSGEREVFINNGEYMSASTPGNVREQRGIQILANDLKANGENLTCVDYLARSSPRSGTYSFTWTAYSGTPLPDGANPIRYVTVDW